MTFFDLLHKRWFRYSIFGGFAVVIFVAQWVSFRIFTGNDAMKIMIIDIVLISVGFILGKMSGIDETMHRIEEILGTEALVRVAMGKAWSPYIKEIELVMKNTEQQK